MSSACLPRSWLRFALCSAVVLCIGWPSPARADAGPGPVAGSWTRYNGPANTINDKSYGSATWDSVPSPKTVTVKAYGTAMAAGKCMTTYFDWGLYTVNQHYDARASRDCRNLAAATASWTDARSDIGGMQKLAVCYATNNTLASGGSCIEHPSATASVNGINANFTSTNCSISRFVRDSNGNTTYLNNGPLYPACV